MIGAPALKYLMASGSRRNRAIRNPYSSIPKNTTNGLKSYGVYFVRFCEQVRISIGRRSCRHVHDGSFGAKAGYVERAQLDGSLPDYPFDSTLPCIRFCPSLYSQESNPRYANCPKILSAKGIEIKEGLSELQTLRIKRHNAVIKELSIYSGQLDIGGLTVVLDACVEASHRYVSSGEVVFSTHEERIELYKQQLDLLSYFLRIAESTLSVGEGCTVRYQKFLYAKLDCEIKILELTQSK
jgi:hypothetical protein